MNLKNNNKWQWLKAVALVTALMSVQVAFATDTISSVPELGTQASAGVEIIQFVAKYGGILAIVVSVIAIGMGKAKGEIGMVLCSLGIMIGGLGAAWGFFTTSFTHGFVW